MAGETIKTEAICLSIRPWSQTSHVVAWLTPMGKISTMVKGAARPKSSFLGQYDLNYTCEIVYYARAKGELHALRECCPLELRENLRGNFRMLALADYFRSLPTMFAPAGPYCKPWFDLLARYLDGMNCCDAWFLIPYMVRYDLDVLKLSGITPDFSNYDPSTEASEFSVESAAFVPGGRRILRIPRKTAEFLLNPSEKAENLQIPLDAARVISVFYSFHLDCTPDVRRSVLRIISNNL